MTSWPSPSAMRTTCSLTHRFVSKGVTQGEQITRRTMRIRMANRDEVLAGLTGNSDTSRPGLRTAVTLATSRKSNKATLQP